MMYFRPSDDLRIPVTVLIGVKLTNYRSELPRMKQQVTEAVTKTSMAQNGYKRLLQICLAT